MKIYHTLEPVYDENSKVLILGSIPSVKSREIGFYYAHPRNRFWWVLEQIYCEKIGDNKKDKILFLKKHHIALFDVLQSCDISSSSDQSIKNPVVNDLTLILENSSIRMIFTTGRKAHELYQKYIYPQIKKSAILLPSTSPAHCAKNIEEILIKSYSQIMNYTEVA